MGEKRTEWLRFTTDGQGEIAFPVAEVIGDKPGPTLTITAGIHGAEYPGIAAAIKLFKVLQPEILCGSVRIVTVSNIRAFEERCMFVCPVDNKNPNRFFPGSREGSFTEIMDYYLFNEIIRRGDYYLDLHGGDLVEDLEPFSIYHRSGNDKVDSLSLKMVEHFGLPNIVCTTSKGEWPDGGTTYANASEVGIPGAIVEAGGMGQLDEKYISMHLEGVLNVLKYLGLIQGQADAPKNISYFNSFVWVYSSCKGIFYRTVSVGEEISKGQILGTMEDYFGNELERVESPVSGRVLFLTSSIAIKGKGLLMGVAKR